MTITEIRRVEKAMRKDMDAFLAKCTDQEREIIQIQHRGVVEFINSTDDSKYPRLALFYSVILASMRAVLATAEGGHRDG
jgi:hypothetical protein